MCILGPLRGQGLPSSCNTFQVCSKICISPGMHTQCTSNLCSTVWMLVTLFIHYQTWAGSNKIKAVFSECSQKHYPQFHNYLWQLLGDVCYETVWAINLHTPIILFFPFVNWPWHARQSLPHLEEDVNPSSESEDPISSVSVTEDRKQMEGSHGL